ncbi:hypothetical protein [Streptomyces sp. NPDC007205]|uniref:hypothetical protein n=1 Tax=Streptomyces sp. NPDC007205 TaxID=3154316 RepID=UPI0033C22C47
MADKQSGWVPGSKVMRRYREADDGFKENALHGVLESRTGQRAPDERQKKSTGAFNLKPAGGAVRVPR